MEDWTDEDGDGIPEYGEVHTYNQNNDRTQTTIFDDGNSQPAFILHFYYDNRSYLTSYTEDSNGDGIVDIRHEYSRDQNNYLIQYTKDENGDGEHDLSRIYSYQNDEFGNIIDHSKVETDKNTGQVITQEFNTFGSWRYLFLELEVESNNLPK